MASNRADERGLCIFFVSQVNIITYFLDGGFRILCSYQIRFSGCSTAITVEKWISGLENRVFGFLGLNHNFSEYMLAINAANLSSPQDKLKGGFKQDMTSINLHLLQRD